MKTTHDHEEIKAWARAINGTPQLIDDSEAESDSIGVRIDFPGNDDDRFLPMGEVRDVTWDEFFARFDEQNLEFLLSDETPYTYRLIRREALTEQGQQYEAEYQRVRSDVAEARKRE